MGGSPLCFRSPAVALPFPRASRSIQAPHQCPSTAPASPAPPASPRHQPARGQPCILSSIPRQSWSLSPFSALLSSTPTCSSGCSLPAPSSALQRGKDRSPVTAAHGSPVLPVQGCCSSLGSSTQPCLGRTRAASLPVPATPPRGVNEGVPAPSSPCLLPGARPPSRVCVPNPPSVLPFGPSDSLFYLL